MKISTNQQVIDKLVKTSESYAARVEDGRITHRSAIFIEADEQSNTLTLTSEGELRAIQLIVRKGVEVEASGAALVPASVLKTAISNVSDAEDVSIELEGTKLFITGGSRKLSVGILTLNEVPQIGDAGESPTVISNKEFLKGFNGGASAAESGSTTIASNVFIRVKNKRGVFLSRDGKSANFRTIPIKKSGKDIEVLISKGILSSCVDQIGGGDDIAISIPEINDHEVHFITETDDVIRHIRISSSAHEPNAFKADTYLNRLKESGSTATAVVVVNKKQFIGTMKAADNIYALSDKGVERDIEIAAKKSSITIRVRNTAGFEDTLDAVVYGEGSAFRLRWNQFTSLFGSYPDERDELIFALIPRGDKIQSIMLLADESFRKGDSTDDLDYIALAAVSNV